jgi:diguanylate cyclase (GGDEF)-like protein
MNDAKDVDVAVAAFAAELSSALKTRVVGFVRTPAAWRTAGAEHDAHGWHSVLGELSGHRCLLTRRDSDPTMATIVPLSDSGSLRAAIVIEGDWTAFEETLRSIASSASLALAALDQRAQRLRYKRHLVSGYALARRISRLSSVESIAQQVVKTVSELVGAGRVSLALYMAKDDSLAIAATHGYPRERVADVRVRPGDWVVGHVYSTKRPLFVTDVRLVPAMARHPEQYRSFSFAAVPLLAGRETVGVLTVTDKADGSPFDEHDALILRSISVIAAMSLVAARSEGEAAQLAYAATIDALSGLMNRQSLDNRLHQEVERSKREGTSLAVLMVDVDDFKRINDTHGHQVGDAVLHAVAGAIRSAVRVFDVCARYGGDEFAIVMPNCDHHSAVACAERIRVRVLELNEGADPPLPERLTLSIGVAVMAADESAQDVLSRADRCLYHAKADGKNAVRAEEQPRPPALHEGPWPRAVTQSQTLTADNLPGAATRTRLPYVLVVDNDEDRLKICLEAIKPFNCGLLVARSGALAAKLIEQFGAPLVLMVDLQLASGDAFAAIDALHDDEDSEILAWSSSRDVREFASSRLHYGRVLNTTASAATFTAAIHSSFHRQAALTTPRSTATATEGATAGAAESLIERVRRVCNVPGVAVYLKAPADGGFRLTVNWAEDTAPQPTVDVPMVFDRVRRLGRTVLHHELHEALRGRPAVRSVIGVPIRSDSQVIGVICAFDVAPMRFEARDVAALEAVAASPHEREEAVDPSPSRPFVQRANVAAPDERAAGAHPTALLDRSGGEFAVARERSRARREGRALSIAFFGVAPPRTQPTTADAELDCITETLLRAVRQSDLPIRWSETELLVVFPGLDGGATKAVAERVRAALTAGVRNRLAVSGGVEHIDQDESFDEVVSRARQKVAAAVGQGHSRIV